jgi:hypothetical protein
MKKYRLEYITWKDTYNYFHSDSLLEVYNKYKEVKTEFNVEIHLYLHSDNEYVEMDDINTYIEDAKKRFVLRNWKEFEKYLHEDYEI